MEQTNKMSASTSRKKGSLKRRMSDSLRDLLGRFRGSRTQSHSTSEEEYLRTMLAAKLLTDPADKRRWSRVSGSDTSSAAELEAIEAHSRRYQRNLERAESDFLSPREPIFRSRSDPQPFQSGEVSPSGSVMSTGSYDHNTRTRRPQTVSQGTQTPELILPLPVDTSTENHWSHRPVGGRPVTRSADHFQQNSLPPDYPHAGLHRDYRPGNISRLEHSQTLPAHFPGFREVPRGDTRRLYRGSWAIPIGESRHAQLPRYVPVPDPQEVPGWAPTSSRPNRDSGTVHVATGYVPVFNQESHRSSPNAVPAYEYIPGSQEIPIPSRRGMSGDLRGSREVPHRDFFPSYEQYMLNSGFVPEPHPVPRLSARDYYDGMSCNREVPQRDISSYGQHMSTPGFVHEPHAPPNWNNRENSCGMSCNREFPQLGSSAQVRRYGGANSELRNYPNL